MAKRKFVILLFIIAAVLVSAQTIPYPVTSKEYQDYKEGLIGKIPVQPPVYSNVPKGEQIPLVFQRQQREGLLIPLDDSFQLAMEGNDDYYTSVIQLPFAFDFYGTTYTEFYINNNGNVSFGNPYSTYTSYGFPVNGFPMLAPFWADVDTRSGGQVFYKMESNRVTVIWNAVGYFSNHTDRVNTFELVFTNGWDPVVGLGYNVAFSYADMQWTTGDASGGQNGFGGVPATVGLNKGDGIYYGLIGRFDHEGIDYYGPGGAPSGVSYLDNQLFRFTAIQGNFLPPVFGNLPAETVNIQEGESIQLHINASSPAPENTVYAEVQSDFTAGFYADIISGNPCYINLTINGLRNNVGLHTITITAIDNGTPSLSTVASFSVRIIPRLGDFLIVTNYYPPSISIVDVATNEVFGPFLQGQLGDSDLVDVVVSSDGHFALVSNFNNDTVYQIDLSNLLEPTIAASYNLGFPAEDITLSVDNRYAIVADGGTAHYLAVLDLQSRTTVQVLDIYPHYAQGVTIGPDGKVLINDYANGYVHQYILNFVTGNLSYSGVSIPVASCLNTVISPGGNFAIACSYNRDTKVLKLNADNTINVIQNLGLSSQSAVYSSDGQIALIGEYSSSNDILGKYNVQGNGSLLWQQSFNLPFYSGSGYYGVDVLALSTDNSKAYITDLGEEDNNILVNINLEYGTQQNLTLPDPTGLAMGTMHLTAYFTATITNTLNSTQVQFHQHCSGNPDSYLWNFGDGQTSTEPNPYHIYYTPGLYTVTLTVYKNGESDSYSQTIEAMFNTQIHLTLDGSPYYYSATLAISEGSSLIIDNGVTVNFGPQAGLEVWGSISANGATFSGSETEGWKGIVLHSPVSPVTFNNCNIYNAVVGLKIINSSFTITNLLISKTQIFTGEIGLKVQGASNMVLNNVQVIGYSMGIVFENEARVASSPSLNNTRIRNTSSTLRTESHGLDVLGAVGLTVNNVDIEEYDYGVYWNGLGTTDYRSTPSLNNTRIRNTSSTLRTVAKGVKMIDISRVTMTNDSIIGYPTGLEITNDGSGLLTTTASLNNTRIRNTSSTLRTETTGINFSGHILATMESLDIDEYSTGIYYEGNGMFSDRATVSLNNTRIRNTSSTLRSVTKGLVMMNIGSVTITNDSIIGYPTGLEITNDGSGLLTTTASLNNTRIRNTSSTLRTETKGINFTGHILASMDSLYLEDYATGIYYEGNGMPFNRTTPSLNNTRIRNTSSTLREPLKGVVLKNLAGITLNKNIIYPKVQVGQGNLSGNGIFLQTVQNAQIAHNTIWGLNNGLYATGSSNGTFTHNVIWTNGEQLNTPVILEDSNIPVSNSDISYAQGVFPGTGNLNADPLFVAPDEGNFYLKPRSPLANQGIGAMPFDFEVLAGVRTYTMHPGWNMMGVPYLTRETYSTPVSIFADDLSPFYVAPTYTSIVQLNPSAPPDTLGHIDMSYTGNYVIPSFVRPGIGYWVRNPYATPATIDVYGLMDDGSYNVVLDGTVSPNNGWYLLANPYDRPIGLNNGIIWGEGMLVGLLKYNYVTNSYYFIDSEHPEVIEPWGGFFVKAIAQDAHLYLNYPSQARQQNENQPFVNDIPNVVSRPKLKWEFSLNAKAGEKGDAIILGVGEGANDTLDPLDIPEIPNPPFPQTGILQFSICNNDWENNAGLYTRDIKNSRDGSWSWNLLLNLENMLEDGIFSDIIRISALGAEKIPAGYIFRIVNPADGSYVDLRNEDFLLNVEIFHAEGEPWLIPLCLEVIPLTNDSGEREVFSASNYPNPFNPETTISYKLPTESFVTLEIYNLKGQLVKRLVSENKPSGAHKAVWNGSDQQGREVASGFYFYRLKTKDNQLTRKILLMK
ncbi:MAG: PKD domain-containing protein [Candidatus Cloacimonas acidaminovorans]|nr:PKD domain-containing protein [Candidatus Cloacimonas acidaminovorans]